MNEIFVRTNKGEYSPGEVVYGVVYLSINSPTAGRGVQLNVKSQEYFCYEYQIGTIRHRVEDRGKHVDCNNVLLYEQEDPFSLGCYKLPFRLRLHTDIPGSFQASGESPGTDQWLAQVQFWLEAVVLNAENMAAHQPLVLLQCKPQELVENQAVVGISVEHRLRCLSILQGCINFTFRMLQNYYVTGESAKGRLVVTNDTSTKVVGFKVKLMRSLVLMSKTEISADCMTSKMKKVGPRIFIQPEGETKTIWETPDALTKNQSVCVKIVLDNLLIPLKDQGGKPTFPTVRSRHLECEYAVELYIHLSNKDVVHLVYPLKGILPESNKVWQTWQAPSWARLGEVLNMSSGRSTLTVSHEELNGETFAEFPGFQAL